jgi:hypothetical protein
MKKPLHYYRDQAAQSNTQDRKEKPDRKNPSDYRVGMTEVK